MQDSDLLNAIERHKLEVRPGYEGGRPGGWTIAMMNETGLRVELVRHAAGSLRSALAVAVAVLDLQTARQAA